jgi:predicted ATPase
LRELRDAAQEDRAAARISAGQEADAVAELEALVQTAPYRERRWALLVLSLYRGGRQAEALATVRRVRSLLADQLGIEPGPELQSLEQQVLHQDPRLVPADREGPARGSSLSVPRKPIIRPLSSFLGREPDLALLAELVGADRLVTVVGTAGAGKTRLAIEYAVGRDDEDGPWFVRLADVADPAVLPSTVAAAVGVAESVAATPEALAEAVHRHRGLLVLDNCEHLVEHIAPLVRGILDRAPGLHVLATSRIPLGIDGERLAPLGPLPIAQAIELLIDRIRTARPTWRPEQSETEAVRHIATALDAIPLALELAAARAPILGVRALAALLEDRFTVLGRTPAGSPTSHSTLEAAIGWSVDLLSDGERSALLRLWPFEGGFPLEAVEPAETRLETLSSLVSQSLVVADTTVAPGRYRLLETIRLYCRGHDPYPAASQTAHAAFVHQLAAQSAQGLGGEDSGHAVHVLTRELPNIRAAIAHDLKAKPEAALRTAGRLIWFWGQCGLPVEGRRLLERCLAAAPHAPAADIARARVAHACLEYEYAAGDVGHARETIAEVTRSLSAAAGAGADDGAEDRALYAEARFYQALLQIPDGDPPTALAAAEDAHRIAGELGLGWLIASAQMTRGAALLMLGRTADGRRVLHAAIRDAQARGVTWTTGLSELLLGQSLLASGDPAAALTNLRSALRRFRGDNDLSHTVAVLYNGAQALAADGETERAQRLWSAVHQHAVRHGIRLHQTYTAGGLANVRLADPQTSSDEDPPSIEATVALFLES